MERELIARTIKHLISKADRYIKHGEPLTALELRVLGDLSMWYNGYKIGLEVGRTMK